MIVRAWDANIDPPWQRVNEDPSGLERVIVYDLPDGNTWFGFRNIQNSKISLLSVAVYSPATITELTQMEVSVLNKDVVDAAALAEHLELIDQLENNTKNIGQIQLILAKILKRLGPTA